MASRVLMTAGTPGHMYLDDRQAKWLQQSGRPEGTVELGTRRTRAEVGRRERPTVRHGLVDRLHPVTHGELVHDLLRGLFEVHLPGVVAFGVGDLHHAVVLDIGDVVEKVLREREEGKWSVMWRQGIEASTHLLPNSSDVSLH